MSELLLQNEMNQLVAEKLAKALGSKLDGKFISVAYPAGFNYGITYGNNAYYNEDTLSTLNSTLRRDRDGIFSFSEQKLSDLMLLVLKDSSFEFSQETQKKLSKWDDEAQAQIAAVLSAFRDSGYKFSDPVPPGGKITDVFTQLEAQFGQIRDNCDNLPVTLSALRDALASYIKKANQAYLLHSRASQAEGSRNAAINNATTPGRNNGGLQTDDESYYVGFDKLLSANQLIGSLQTDGNQFTIQLSGDSFSSKECNVHLEGKGGILFPIFDLLTLTSGSTEVDVSQFTSAETSFSMQITYPGLTVVPAIPQVLSSDNKKGWYAANILQEIKDKTGNSGVDGYKLQSSEFSVQELFGLNGRLNFLKTLVISREPSIDVTFKKVDVAKFTKNVHQSASVRVKLLGFIPLGTVSKNYSLTEVKTDEAAQSVTLHLGAPNVSGTTPLKQQVAYVLGGVPVYSD